MSGSTERTLRPVRASDVPRLSELLEDAFAHYRDTLRYTPEVLALFRSTWWTPPRGFVIERAGRIEGVAMAGTRRLHMEGSSLLAAHVGPVAVLPGLQNRGLGTAMMRALEDLDVDLLTLTTNEVEGVRPFYEALGYEVLERFVPAVYDPETPAPILAAPRPGGGCLVEEADGDEGEVHRFGRGWVRAVFWPVRSRGSGWTRELRTCQVLGHGGLPADRQRAFGALRSQAADLRCALIWGRPNVVAGIPGFRPGAGLGVARMVRARSARADAILTRASSYLPAGVSP